MDINKIDTSEMLSEQDYRDMQDIKDIKKRVLAYVDLPILIDYIVDLIEKSPYLTFKNERSRKYIDKRRPIFYIKVEKDIVKNSEKYNRKSNFGSENEEIKYYSNVVFMEVITYVTRYITESLKNNPELENYVSSKDIFKNISNESRKSILSHASVLSTMFGMRFSQEDNSNITLEMLI